MQIKIFLLACAYALNKTGTQARAGFGIFERHQRSQNKPEASQRTLIVCGSCGTPLSTTRITCDVSSW